MKSRLLLSIVFALVLVTGFSGCTYHTLFPLDLSERNSVASRPALPRTRGLLGPQAFLMDSDRRKLPDPRLEITPEVHSELADRGNSKLVLDSLGRGQEFLPMVRAVLAEEGLPDDMLSVAIIESGFRPEARSSAGAVGMWQLMKGTARLYGLDVNLLQDQRKDPTLASVAAARHLRDLYLLYKDWNLAIAAYNAGTGSINGAIARAGSDDFWKLARSGGIKRETARFVSRFIATSLLVKSHTTGIMQAQKSEAQKKALG